MRELHLMDEFATALAPRPEGKQLQNGKHNDSKFGSGLKIRSESDFVCEIN